MKTNASKIIANLAFWFTLATANAQVQPDFFNAMAENNYTAISSLMAADVDITILDDVQFVSGKEAAMLLKNFTQGIGLKKIEPLYNGNSAKNVSSYKLAKISSAQGYYRIFVYTESSGGKSCVKEIRVEKF